MYIVYKDNKYPCTCQPGPAMVYTGLPDGFPAQVDGEIILCADDGFVLRVDRAEDYQWQIFLAGELTLTNVMEPAPEPVHLTAEELREEVYNTRAVILWGDDRLTVTQAAQLWLYYAAEGDVDQAGALTDLIAAAKADIRAQYPDAEVSAWPSP